MLVKAYMDTYKFPANITNCSNNYGPYQFPEKLIPLIINNALQGKKLPVYGDGKNVRDWLFVEDHAKAIDMVQEQGRLFETYNVGGHNEKQNIEIIDDKYGIAICDEDEIYTRQFIAKIADGIIALDKLHAGFCIGRISKDSIAISARSFDQMNVQLVMEELNGGGHFNNAATQIVGITINEAKERLINVLKQQDTTGEEIMKVILVKDVKGKGKANDVIEIPSGHGLCDRNK